MRKMLMLAMVVVSLSSVLVGCKAEGEVGDPDKMSTSIAPL